MSSEPAREPTKRLRSAPVLRRRGSRAFLALAATGIGVQLLTLVSGPLVARMLGPHGRGALALVFVISLICTLMATGGLPAAIAHLVAKAGAPARDALQGTKQWWLVVGAAAGVVAGAATAASFHGSDQWGSLTGAASLITILAVATVLLTAMLQGEGGVRNLNIVKMSSVATYVALVASLFLLGGTSSPWLILSAYALAQALSIGIGWRRLRPASDVAAPIHHSTIFSFARRSWISGVTPMDAFGLDQLIVAAVLGQAYLGLYAVAVSASTLPVIALTGIGGVLLSRMSAQAGAAARSTMVRWLAAAVALDLTIVAGLEAVIGPALRLLFGAEFVPATNAARLLIIGFGFFGLRRILAAVVQARGHARRASVVEGLGTLVLVASVVVGARHGDITGAALAVVISAGAACAALAVIVSMPAAADA